MKLGIIFDTNEVNKIQMKYLLLITILITGIQLNSQFHIGADVSSLRNVGLFNNNTALMHGYGLTAGFKTGEMSYFSRFSQYSIGSYSLEAEVYAYDINTIPNVIIGNYRVFPTIYDINFGIERIVWEDFFQTMSMHVQTGGGLRYMHDTYGAEFNTLTYQSTAPIGKTNEEIRIYTQVGLKLDYSVKGFDLYTQLNASIQDILFGIVYAGAATEYFFDARFGITKNIDFSKIGSGNDDE